MIKRLMYVALAFGMVFGLFGQVDKANAEKKIGQCTIVIDAKKNYYKTGNLATLTGDKGCKELGDYYRYYGKYQEEGFFVGAKKVKNGEKIVVSNPLGFGFDEYIIKVKTNNQGSQQSQSTSKQTSQPKQNNTTSKSKESTKNKQQSQSKQENKPKQQVQNTQKTAQSKQVAKAETKKDENMKKKEEKSKLKKDPKKKKKDPKKKKKDPKKKKKDSKKKKKDSKKKKKNPKKKKKNLKKKKKMKKKGKNFR